MKIFIIIWLVENVITSSKIPRLINRLENNQSMIISIEKLQEIVQFVHGQT